MTRDTIATCQRVLIDRGRGQSTVEMALLMMAIAVALAVFFSFIRSSVSSRIKAGADTFGHGMVHDGS